MLLLLAASQGLLLAPAASRCRTICMAEIMPPVDTSLIQIEADAEAVALHVVEVVESRLAPLLLYVAVGATLLVPELLEQIPDGASHGVLCFIGAKGLLQGNQFVERLFLLFVAPSAFPQTSYTQAPVKVMHLYTLVQLGCFGVCWDPHAVQIP